MDNIGNFIMDLAEKQDLEYKDIATNAYNRWAETGTISRKMAIWIRRGAKIKGMRMPDELRTMIGEILDGEELERDVQSPYANSQPWAADLALFEELLVLLQELQVDFVQVALPDSLPARANHAMSVNSLQTSGRRICRQFN